MCVVGCGTCLPSLSLHLLTGCCSLLFQVPCSYIPPTTPLAPGHISNCNTAGDDDSESCWLWNGAGRCQRLAEEDVGVMDHWSRAADFFLLCHTSHVRSAQAREGAEDLVVLLCISRILSDGLDRVCDGLVKDCIEKARVVSKQHRTRT